MSWKKRIAQATVARLSTYNRVLDKLCRERVQIISSEELGEETGYGAAQIRKDLSLFW